MTPLRQRQVMPGLLLGSALLGALLYLSGLSATLQLGDASLPGVLLIPDLPMPLYIVMAIVVVAGVGVTLLASIRQRRRMAVEKPRQPEAVRTPWQALVSTLASLALLALGLVWLLRHGPEVSQFLERLRIQVSLAQEFLEAGTHSLVQQVHSPTTGYPMFMTVILAY